MHRATPAASTDAAEIRPVDAGLMMKVFYAFAALAILSLAISVAGKWYGHSISMAGHTDDASPREVVIGNNVISAPANTIRFERARRHGIAQRLDLYLRWPEMQGYTELARDDFNHAGGSKRIVFLTFEERMMSRDMSGRFAPIYSAMIARPGTEGPAGLTLYAFDQKSGYLNEVLAVGERPGQEPFVARCLDGASAGESLAPCERDIHVGDNLSLSYRFPKELLANWRDLETEVMKASARMLKTGK